MQRLREQNGKDYFAEWHAFRTAPRKIAFAPGGRNVLIIGDSFAQDLFHALYLAGNKSVKQLRVFYNAQPVFGKRPVEVGNPRLVVNTPEAARRYEQQFTETMGSAIITKADTVVVAARWKPWAARRIGNTIAALRERTAAPIIIAGPRPEFQPHLPAVVANHGPAAVARFETSARRALNAEMKALVQDAIYLDYFELLCDQRCNLPVFVPGSGNLMMWDFGHWTLAGAAHVGSMLKSSALREFFFRSDDDLEE